nr:4-coumarate--CoA ligase 1-like [Onthophagus taurus]
MNNSKKSNDNLILRKNNEVYGFPFKKEIGQKSYGYFVYEKMIQNKDKIFQIDGLTGESETYGNLLTRCKRVALEMINRGVTEKDVVLLCSQNTLDAIVPVFSTQFINTTLCSVDPSQSVKEVAYLLNLAKPKMGFIEKESVNLIKDALEINGLNMEIIVMIHDDDKNSLGYFLKPKIGEDDFKPKVIKDSKIAGFMFFSSGTTGLPKGIPYSGCAVLNNNLSIIHFGIEAKVASHLSTFYWVSALVLTTMVLLNDGMKVVIPTRDTRVFAKAMSDYKVTFAFTSYTFAVGLNETITNDLNFNHLEYLVLGGSIVPENHLIKCRKLLPKTLVLVSYGQTEAGHISSFTKETYHFALQKLSSVGQPIPGTIIKIADPNTEEPLGINQKGEICIKTNWHFSGYHNADSSNVFDKSGYLKTGDLGYFDEDNCLYVSDRLKETFKFQGWHVSPAAIEEVLLKHSAIKEGVVIGIPHPLDETHALAVVVLKEGCEDVREEEIVQFVNERVSDREKLRSGVKFLNELPKAPSGKIMKRIIREKFVVVQ